MNHYSQMNHYSLDRMQHVIALLRMRVRKVDHEAMEPNGCLKCLLSSAITWLSEYAATSEAKEHE